MSTYISRTFPRLRTSSTHPPPLRSQYSTSRTQSSRLSDNPIYSPSSSSSSSSTSSRSPLHPSNPFYIPPPTPQDFPPISERLRPLLPFFLYWTALTSLAYHLLRVRKENEEEMGRKEAQISVLEGLIERLQPSSSSSANELSSSSSSSKPQPPPTPEEIQRELEMVHLRPRSILTQSQTNSDGSVSEEGLGEGRTVGWREVLLGRKKAIRSKEEEEKKAEEEWKGVLAEAITTSQIAPPPNSPSSSPSSTPYPISQAATNTNGPGSGLPGTVATRAPSSDVYM